MRDGGTWRSAGEGEERKREEEESDGGRRREGSNGGGERGRPDGEKEREIRWGRGGGDLAFSSSLPRFPCTCVFALSIQIVLVFICMLFGILRARTYVFA